MIELLVVVTIIVVLLALLTPALDKAIYQADLTVCGANLKGMAGGAVTYAMNHKRQYPYRAMVDDSSWWNRMPIVLRQAPTEPLYGVTRDYIPRKMYLDPFAGKIDFDTIPDNCHVQGNYAIWFGFGYNGYPKVAKVGDKLRFGGRRFALLASDFDYILSPNYVGGSHPDSEGVMNFITFNFTAIGFGSGAVPAGPTGQSNDLNWAGSRWERGDNFQRGLIDMNFAADDGAVTRVNGVTRNEDDTGGPTDDPRMSKVPAAPGYEAEGTMAKQYYNVVTR